ncbi:DUF6177 family protein [Kribbella sp.]|uniref:DUF6177 family protein n=1 Tax=Kribbella sp. TaxID=1871183 RepID=UPI002D5F7659|nr:DUF6177 family protein [Kribbella sp.]HZX08776.1 DUF6177 family protein [Kribbella sp.]
MPNELIFSPGVDLVTDRVAVVMQDRPVVGMSAWLSDALASAMSENRGLQLVTPRTSRITWPVRSLVLQSILSRWVVVGEDGEYFDGLNGTRVVWNDEMFVARSTGEPDERTSDMHPDFVVQEDPFAHLQLTVRVRHKPVAALVLGKVAETLFGGAAGGGPGGWSTSEPVTQPWSREALTEYCRGRAPAPTMLILSGPSGPDTKPAVGTLEIRRTTAGVDETVSLSVAQPGLGLPTAQAVGDLVDAVADDFELVSAVAMGAFGAADGTYQPRFAGLGGPVGLGVGHEAVRDGGLKDALDVAGIKALAIGPSHEPGVWYPIGDGRSAEDWEKYSAVMRKLVPSEAQAGQR